MVSKAKTLITFGFPKDRPLSIIVTLIKFALALLPFLFVSCATITRGVHDKLSVQSQPPGAQVTLSTGEKGVTPAKFIKSRRESLSVTVSKPGYISQTIRVESKASATGGAAMAGNAVAGGLIGLAVDAGSGAMFSLYPNPVSVQLVPNAGSAPKKRPVKKTSQPKQKDEIKLSPRTSRPTSVSPRSENLATPPPVPAATPAEERTLQSVETPPASPSP